MLVIPLYFPQGFIELVVGLVEGDVESIGYLPI